MAVDSIARALAATRELVTAYQYAVAAGYSGTEDEFKADMGTIGSATAQIGENTGNIELLRALFAGIQPSMTATQNYEIGDFVVVDFKLYRVTAPISSGSTLAIGTNVVETTVGGIFNAYGLSVVDGALNVTYLVNDEN